MTQRSVYADAMARESIAMDNGIHDNPNAPNAAMKSIISNQRHLNRKYIPHYGAVLERFRSGLLKVEILLKDNGYYGDIIIPPETYEKERERFDADPFNYNINEESM